MTGLCFSNITVMIMSTMDRRRRDIAESWREFSVVLLNPVRAGICLKALYMDILREIPRRISGMVDRMRGRKEFMI